MKKLSLHKETLTELTTNQLLGVAGAVPQAGSEECTIRVSDRSCVCGFGDGGCNIVVSAGSCVCDLLDTIRTA